jgi:hypothetical protein
VYELTRPESVYHTHAVSPIDFPSDYFVLATSMPITSAVDMTSHVMTALSPTSTVQSTYGSQPSQMNNVTDDGMCQDTDTPLYHLMAGEDDTWFMFHLVNAGAAQELGFSIDEHEMWVIAADGAYVKPVRTQVST